MERACAGKGALLVSWLLQLVAAGILLQTLFFKFTGAEESVYIFTKLGMEPWGRIGSGVAELLASLLLLIPGFAGPGAALAMGVIGGAIASHLGPLGIVVMDDGGLLFGLALTVFFACGGVLALRLGEVRAWMSRGRSWIGVSRRNSGAEV